MLEAVGQAFKADDPERVGQILETHGWSLVSAMQSRYVAAWAKDIPEAVLCKNVERLIVAVSAEFVGTGAATAAWVEEASRQLEKPRGDGEGEARRRALAGLLGFVKGVRTAKQRKYADAAQFLLKLDSGTEEAGLLGATAIYARARACVRGPGRAHRCFPVREQPSEACGAQRCMLVCTFLVLSDMSLVQN